MRLINLVASALCCTLAPELAESAGIQSVRSFLGRTVRTARTALSRNAEAPTAVVEDGDDELVEVIVSEEQQEHPSLRLRPRVVSLNVMVAGLSGLGKTTACAHLLESWKQQSDFENSSTMASATAIFKRTLSSKSQSVVTKTKSTKDVDPSRQFERYDEKENTILRVRIIDTPGFGNRVDHRDSVRPIARYIAKCRSRQYKKEISPKYHPNRENVEACDDLVHVCLYFLTPGRFLEMDSHFLKQIQKEVCIVPIIAKADTLTEEEVAAYRAEVVQAFAEEGIVPYNFDTQESGKRPVPYHRGRRSGEPLAIVSRDGVYPWGEVRSVDPAHSDLMLVRDLLLSGHTETFVELARAKYGEYRAGRIRKRRRADILKYAALGILVARACGVPMPGRIAVAMDGIKENMSRALARLLGLVSTFVAKYQNAEGGEGQKIESTDQPADGQPSSPPILFPWKENADSEEAEPAPVVVKEQGPRQALFPWQNKQKNAVVSDVEDKEEALPEVRDEGKRSEAPEWFLWLGGKES